MREKHLALLDNIGTFAEEDEAFDLLTMLTWLLPVIIVTSAALDLVLAVVYLKWLHPWKIILQEVCYHQVVFLICCMNKTTFRNQIIGTRKRRTGLTILFWKRLLFQFQVSNLTQNRFSLAFQHQILTPTDLPLSVTGRI